MDRNIEIKSLELVARITAHLDVETTEYIETAILDSGRDATRSFRGTVRQTIHTRDEGRCFYCGAVVAIEKMHVDHVFPWAKGGKTIEVNGVVSCPTCNRKKSAKVW